MNEKITIYCKNNKTYQEFDAGISVLDIYKKMNIQLPAQLACARVNNKTESLNYICYNSKNIEFVGVNDPSGMRAYVRSLCFVLAKAVYDVFSGKLLIEHPLSKGYYCTVEIGRQLTEEDISAIKKQMQKIIDADLPFQFREEQTEEVIKLFQAKNIDDKVALLETAGEVYSKYNILGDYIDDYYGCLLPSTGWIYLFNIIKHNGGLLLQVPNMNAPDQLQPYVKQEKMLDVFQDLIAYQKAMNMSNVGELNRAIRRGEISTIVKVAEAMQERRIGKIADEIYEKYVANNVRIVLISGPSSSGKTTFCKRLQIQLLTNTLRPVSISLDDYYVNRVDTPKDENGELDYESLYAIDLEQFNKDLKKILAGEEVALPTYDFQKGERVYKGNTVQLKPNSVLVMEGIHAMNPALIPDIPAESTYKVYVSALTSISLDDHNWIPTTDNRLIRRIVRDHRFRGYSAKETISRWHLVRKGEDQWIFPFQENADAMFNSAMLYELAALRRIAETILKDVPQSEEEYSESHRLLKFLRYFNYVDMEELPKISLLREFVGGSSFQY
jgi:uridine kinase